MEEAIKFRYYPTERLIINSIDSRLTNSEKRVRRFLMNYTIDNNKPYNYKEEVPMISGLCNDDIKNSFKGLLDKSAIVQDEEGNINFIYPVSALPTNHVVKLSDGKTFNAMCAIDSIGSAFTFKQDIEIESICSNSGEPISIKIKNGELENVAPESTSILHVDLNRNDNWSGSC